MMRALKAWWARRRFEKAFAAEINRIKSARAAHGRVNDARAILEARVQDALSRKLSA